MADAMMPVVVPMGVLMVLSCGLQALKKRVFAAATLNSECQLQYWDVLVLIRKDRQSTSSV